VDVPFEQEATGKKRKERTTTSPPGPAIGRGKKIGTSQKPLATNGPTQLNKGKKTEQEPTSEDEETEAEEKETEDTDVEESDGEDTEVDQPMVKRLRRTGKLILFIPRHELRLTC